jgi:hypothetical protein
MTSESNKNNFDFYYVYIIQSTDFPNKFYTGFTENLQKRLADHNSGKIRIQQRTSPGESRQLSRSSIEIEPLILKDILKALQAWPLPKSVCNTPH